MDDGALKTRKFSNHIYSISSSSLPDLSRCPRSTVRPLKAKERPFLEAGQIDQEIVKLPFLKLKMWLGRLSVDTLGQEKKSYSIGVETRRMDVGIRHPTRWGSHYVSFMCRYYFWPVSTKRWLEVQELERAFIYSIIGPELSLGPPIALVDGLLTCLPSNLSADT